MSGILYGHSNNLLQFGREYVRHIVWAFWQLVTVWYSKLVSV